MNTRRWQDVFNTFLGLALCISPWAFGYADMPTTAVWNAVIIGLAIVAVDSYALFRPREEEELLTIGFGAWLIASPWILGFAHSGLALVTALIGGILLIELSVWAIVVASPHEHWWSKYHWPGTS